jgi:hypothetical protein
VGNILREKLQSTLGELAEAKHRIRELEASHLNSGLAQGQTAQQLFDSSPFFAFVSYIWDSLIGTPGSGTNGPVNCDFGSSAKGVI